MGFYSEAQFVTKNETENHEQRARTTDDDQVLVGICVYGKSKAVSKALDGLKFSL